MLDKSTWIALAHEMLPDETCITYGYKLEEWACAWFATSTHPCLSELGSLGLDGSPVSWVRERPTMDRDLCQPTQGCIAWVSKMLSFVLSQWDVVVYRYRQNLTSPFWNNLPRGKWRMFFINPAVSAELTASQQGGHILKQSAPSTFPPCPPGR